MRGLFWFLALLTLAVVAALSARFNTGYVLFVYAPYKMEMALSLFVILLVGGFFGAYGLLRLLSHALRLPSRVRAYRLRRGRNKARSALQQALSAYFEGSFKRAEKLAAAALKMDESPGLSAVVAARAAHELGRAEARDSYLEAAGSAAPEARSLRLITEADLLLEQRRHREALDVLSQLREIAPKNVSALRLELKAYIQSRNWDQVLATLVRLRKADAIDAVSADQIRLNAYEENLALQTVDARALLGYWGRIPAADRVTPRLALAGGRHLIALGEHDAARDVVERALEKEWDPELVALYGDCTGSDLLGQIERAERWLKTHPGDAALLLALGKLCAAQSLWGKARSYLEASIALEPTRAAHGALAQLLERIGLPDEALRYNRRSLDPRPPEVSG